MKCNEARRMVVPFVKKELSEREMEAFLNHVESCEDCMEELDTYFMVYKAIVAIDTGAHDEYDFKKLLAEDIRSAKRSIFRRKASRIFHVVVLTVAEVLLILSIYTGVQMKQGLAADSIFERAILRLYMQERGDTAEQLLTETESEMSVSGTDEMETGVARTADGETEPDAE
ncbi:MAG: zf-HC2 domain-containing protein [Lachnospiraceae bacterium]|nr:zf-HC2 domain-containing protein [Lachnospiraceae bacterium]